MSDILWPAGYVPGFTDHFVSNEVIVTGLSVQDVWPFLDIPSRWPSYYPNSADIRFHDGKGPLLGQCVRFFFSPACHRRKLTNGVAILKKSWRLQSTKRR